MGLGELIRQLILVALLAHAWSAAFGQTSEKLPRVGFIAGRPLVIDPCAGQRPFLCEFLRALAEKGWVDGRTMRLVLRSHEGEGERLRPIMEEFVRMPVDVVVTFNDGPGWMWVNITTRIPIVLAACDMPVEGGLAASLSRPGGNLTGVVTWADWSIEGKRIAILKEAAPRMSKVAVLTYKVKWDAWRSLARPLVAPVTIAAARALGLSVIAIGADATEDLEAAFESALRSGAQGIMVTDYPPAGDEEFQLKVSELAIRHRLPVIHSFYHAANAEALLVYGHDLRGDWRKAAYLVDKILRGAKAGDLPFEQPSKLELLVNLKAAGAIGLSVPDSIIAQANRVTR